MCFVIHKLYIHCHVFSTYFSHVTDFAFAVLQMAPATAAGKILLLYQYCMAFCSSLKFTFLYKVYWIVFWLVFPQAAHLHKLMQKDAYF